jgi:hypothetical protein
VYASTFSHTIHNSVLVFIGAPFPFAPQTTLCHHRLLCYVMLCYVASTWSRKTGLKRQPLRGEHSRP